MLHERVDNCQSHRTKTGSVRGCSSLATASTNIPGSLWNIQHHGSCQADALTVTMATGRGKRPNRSFPPNQTRFEHTVQKVEKSFEDIILDVNTVA